MKTLKHVHFARIIIFNPSHSEAIAFIEEVKNKLEYYPKESKEFKAVYAKLLINLGTEYLGIKKNKKAKENYEEVLMHLQAKGKSLVIAVTYHQLGIVAQEEKDFKEARKNYLEALKIKQEFNARYEQAVTYHQLGMVAEEEKDFGIGLENYSLALDIYIFFEDDHCINIVLKSISRVLEKLPAVDVVEELNLSEKTKQLICELFNRIKKDKKK